MGKFLSALKCALFDSELRAGLIRVVFLEGRAMVSVMAEREKTIGIGVLP